MHRNGIRNLRDYLDFLRAGGERRRFVFRSDFNLAGDFYGADNTQRYCFLDNFDFTSGLVYVQVFSEIGRKIDLVRFYVRQHLNDNLDYEIGEDMKLR